MKSQKSIELIAIPLYYLLVAYAVIYFRLEYVGSVILFFGVPTLYLNMRKKEMFLKNIEVSIIVAIIFGFTQDFVATVGGAWFETSLTGIRVLGIFPIEFSLWAILCCFFMLSFYNYFLNVNRNKRFFEHGIRKGFWLVSAAIIFIGVVLVAMVVSTDKHVLSATYMYLVVILGFCIIPSVLLFSQYPRLFPRFLKQGVYFVLIGLIYEYAALVTKQWGFNGLYIGTIHILSVSFPVEELLWWFLAPVGFGAFYEYYFDDEK